MSARVCEVPSCKKWRQAGRTRRKSPSVAPTLSMARTWGGSSSGNLFQRGNQAVALLQIRGQQMKSHPGRGVPGGGQRDDVMLDGLALLQGGLDQIEQKPRAFLPPQRTAVDIIDGRRHRADGEQDGQQPAIQDLQRPAGGGAPAARIGNSLTKVIGPRASATDRSSAPADTFAPG